jgi:CheY-like chemotaxis protein
MEGYTVVVAAQGSDALTICADATRRIDLLVTDVIMSGMSGPELVERLASLRPGLKVLYISGYSRGDAMPRSRLHSGNAFLQKPFTGELLARKVREVLDSTAW